jgi:hypothetical protein
MLTLFTAHFNVICMWRIVHGNLPLYASFNKIPSLLAFTYGSQPAAVILSKSFHFLKQLIY